MNRAYPSITVRKNREAGSPWWESNMRSTALLVWVIRSTSQASMPRRPGQALGAPTFISHALLTCPGYRSCRIISRMSSSHRFLASSKLGSTCWKRNCTMEWKMPRVGLLSSLPVRFWLYPFFFRNFKRARDMASLLALSERLRVSRTPCPLGARPLIWFARPGPTDSRANAPPRPFRSINALPGMVDSRRAGSGVAPEWCAWCPCPGVSIPAPATRSNRKVET
mmetsp:Transcript_109181/g.250482  ORF Transcript_109181/g.250482 Transcript_109181/m.250482 type:complete len:224 (-) Transcript_109181:62-733(-)